MSLAATLPRAPWYDRRGRVSALRCTALAVLVAPALLLAARAAAGRLGAEPLAEAINTTGTTGIRILVASLAVTPLRRLTGWNRLVDVRRMIGVSAFLYIAAHFALYAVQQADLAKVASEIASRIYLTIGFTALLGLAALAATSTDGMVRRLGADRWRHLHRLAYPIVLLALTHQLLQVRLQDYVEPLVLAGIVVWLFLMRWATSRGPITPARALGLALAATVATALGEALYLAIRVGAPVLTVLGAQFSFATGTRPATVVLAITAGAAVAAMLASRWRATRPVGVN